MENYNPWKNVIMTDENIPWRERYNMFLSVYMNVSFHEKNEEKLKAERKRLMKLFKLEED